MKRLFALQDALDHVVNERAMIYGKGEHPKHRLMRYHDFFIENIADGEKVIDIGCGYGAVARSIARARPGSIVMGVDWATQLTSVNSVGIMAGLVLGKPLGIILFCLLAVSLKICRLPAELQWRHLIGAAMLGGIGFTMSIFITNLAFDGQAELINASKMAILLASFCAGLAGLVWLGFTTATTDNNRPIKTSENNS